MRDKFVYFYLGKVMFKAPSRYVRMVTEEEVKRDPVIGDIKMDLMKKVYESKEMKKVAKGLRRVK